MSLERVFKEGDFFFRGGGDVFIAMPVLEDEEPRGEEKREGRQL